MQENFADVADEIQILKEKIWSVEGPSSVAKKVKGVPKSQQGVSKVGSAAHKASDNLNSSSQKEILKGKKAGRSSPLGELQSNIIGTQRRKTLDLVVKGKEKGSAQEVWAYADQANILSITTGSTDIELEKPPDCPTHNTNQISTGTQGHLAMNTSAATASEEVCQTIYLNLLYGDHSSYMEL